MRKVDRKYLKTVSQLEDMLIFSRMHKIKLDEYLKANPTVDMNDESYWLKDYDYVIYRRYNLFIVIFKKGDVPIDFFLIGPDNISLDHIIFTLIGLTDWQRDKETNQE